MHNPVLNVEFGQFSVFPLLMFAKGLYMKHYFLKY